MRTKLTDRFFIWMALGAWLGCIPMIYFGYGSPFLYHWMALSAVLAGIEFFYHYIR